MIYFASIFSYLIILSIIGAMKARRVKNQDDFAVAGRSLSPWVMVLTMLAVWIGTGSIVGNAEKTYETGMAALLLPAGTFFGMILLSLIAAKARRIEASTVPEMIGKRFGQGPRALAVVSLIVAYMIIVSYQFNAGGAVLEVITGNRQPVMLPAGEEVTRAQLRGGQVVFTPAEGWDGRTAVALAPVDPPGAPVIDYALVVAPAEAIVRREVVLEDAREGIIIKTGTIAKVIPGDEALAAERYRIASLPDGGTLTRVEPILTKERATIIAAVFIIAYTMLAGLMSLAYTDVVTGSIITLTLLITFPVYWFQSGGWDGMSAAYAAMGDRAAHMQFWGVYSWIDIINFCLPVFLLILGDANQYQRIFASKSARGAGIAVTVMIFAALAIELLIIACAWAAGSMTPDPSDGKYILIYAARHYLWMPLGCLFMVTVVGIIISTADGFLLVPATTFVNDVYLNYIHPRASDRRQLVVSRLMVLLFGVIAYLVSLSFGEQVGFFRKALFAFTIYGASITPTLVAAIVWKRATRAGAMASILSGMTVAILWGEWGFVKDIESLPGWLAQLNAALPAAAVSVASLVAVSLLTGRKRQEAA